MIISSAGHTHITYIDAWLDSFIFYLALCGSVLTSCMSPFVRLYKYAGAVLHVRSFWALLQMRDVITMSLLHHV